MWNRDDLDPTEDFEEFDGIERINYFRFVSDTDSHSTVALTNVKTGLFRELGFTNESVGEGENTTAQVVVHIPYAGFGETPPRRMDKIVRLDPPGTETPRPTYIVQQVQVSTFGTRARLVCTRISEGRLI